MSDYPFSWTIGKLGGVMHNSIPANKTQQIRTDPHLGAVTLNETDTRPLTQDIIDKLVYIADRVRYMMDVDIGGDVLQCPFCNQIAFEYGSLEHREGCAQVMAKTLMDELYPEVKEDTREEGAQ